MANLPPRLETYVLSGRETETIDLKRGYDLKKDTEKEELAKDICAIANTSEQTGYLIIGVNDLKHRKGNPAVPGLSIESEEAYDNQISHVVDNYIENPPRFDIEFFHHSGQRLCVISISCTDRPHIVRANRKTVYVRRGTHNREANIDEILDMARERIGWEITHDISYDLMYDIEELRLPSDHEAVRLIANIVIKRILKIIDLIDQPLVHKYSYILSKAYYMSSDYYKSLSLVNRAIENKNDHRYLMLRSKIYRCYAKIDLDEVNRIEDDEVDGAVNHDKEKFLRKCIDSSESALGDLQTARDMGGGFLEYIELKQELERLRADAQDRLDRIVKEK